MLTTMFTYSVFLNTINIYTWIFLHNKNKLGKLIKNNVQSSFVNCLSKNYYSVMVMVVHSYW